MNKINNKGFSPIILAIVVGTVVLVAFVIGSQMMSKEGIPDLNIDDSMMKDTPDAMMREDDVPGGTVFEEIDSSDQGAPEELTNEAIQELDALMNSVEDIDEDFNL